MATFQIMLLLLLSWNALGFILTIWAIQHYFSRYIHKLREIHKDILSVDKFLLGCQWDVLREWKLNQVHQQKKNRTSSSCSEQDPDA